MMYVLSSNDIPSTTSVSPSHRPTPSPWNKGSGYLECGRPFVGMTRKLLSTSNSCTSCPGVDTSWVEYGFCSHIAGTPRGMQFTDDLDSSSSVGVMALIFAKAQGWKEGGSSGVTLGSNCRRASGSTPKRPLTPWPAPFGSQSPEKSGCPSAIRGAGPPGGITLIVYSVFWAPAWRERTYNSASAAMQAKP